jgi:hypothetical protein
MISFLTGVAQRGLLALLVLLFVAPADAVPRSDGFVPLFDGATLQGWIPVGAAREGFSVRDGLLVCQSGGRGNLFTEAEYSDFALRFEFKLSPGANNGVGIRAPLKGRASRQGMEIQILDDSAPRYARLKATQAHGSVYEVVPAKRGALKPVGEWNEQEILAVGSRVRVTLNGQVIVETDLNEITDAAMLQIHPGIRRERGHIGFLGHGTEVQFRNILVKDLAKPEGSGSAARGYTVLVRAVERAYPATPVTVTVAAPAGFRGVAVWQDRTRVASQVRWSGGKAEVTWIAPELKQGSVARYRLAFEKDAASTPAAGIRVDRKDANLEIRIDDQLFTRYDTTTGPNKPYFYPLIGPGGKRLTRHYPLENAAGETKDHPHHRGLWFTHGAVNGVDYWAEGPRAGKTVHRRFEAIESGPVYGAFRAFTDWIAPDGKKVCEDVRDVRIYNTATGRLMDVEITVRAADSPVIFGDTKEGSFGIRVPDTMRVRGGGGHIETAAGLKDAATWGKRAAWVDYYGPVEGATVGIAILDHPHNLRHPTWWHVRDYGLFAVNPFGLHDFERGQPAGAGDHTLPAGGALTLRYRLYLHTGSTSEARVADVWAAYAEPPRVEVRTNEE